MRTALMSWLRRHALCMHIPASAAGPAGYDQRRPYAVERAVRAQFCPGFRPFGELRRRRNELDYPRLPADTARGRSHACHRGCATADYRGQGATRQAVLLRLTVTVPAG